MAVPTSFKLGPSTTNVLVSKKYLWVHLLNIWLSSILPLYMVIVHFEVYDPAWDLGRKAVFYTTMPFFIFFWYSVWVLMAIGISALFLWIAKKIYPPREGYFPRDYSNKDFRMWSLRATIKKFPLWLSHNFWLPWLDILAFKLYGVKIHGKTTPFDAWVDTEFVEFGKNVVIGQGSIIMGAMLTRDWLIIKKTILHDNTVVGGYTVVAPGTEIGEGTILGGGSATLVGQKLEPGWVYMGLPAKKFKENKQQFTTEL